MFGCCPVGRHAAPTMHSSQTTTLIVKGRMAGSIGEFEPGHSQSHRHRKQERGAREQLGRADCFNHGIRGIRGKGDGAFYGVTGVERLRLLLFPRVPRILRLNNAAARAALSSPKPATRTGFRCT